MNKLIKNITFLLARFSMYLYPPKFAEHLRFTKNFFISKRLGLYLNTDFKTFFVESPINLVGKQYMHIGSYFFSRSGLRIECIDQYNGFKYTPELVIGTHVTFNLNCHIGVINRIVIGNNVLVGSNVLITDHSHGDMSADSLVCAPDKRKLFSKGEVRIGNNVWIGEGVVILPNVSIGNNCIIGANAVVTHCVPDNSVAVGNPAKVINTFVL